MGPGAMESYWSAISIDQRERLGEERATRMPPSSNLSHGQPNPQPREHIIPFSHLDLPSSPFLVSSDYCPRRQMSTVFSICSSISSCRGQKDECSLAPDGSSRVGLTGPDVVYAVRPGLRVATKWLDLPWIRERMYPSACLSCIKHAAMTGITATALQLEKGS